MAALDALAYLGGEAALEPAEIALVQRLVQIRRRTDSLRPVMSCWTYWWCIRSDDQAAVMESIGVTGPRPVTYDLARSVVDILEHCDHDAGVIYVGPAVNAFYFGAQGDGSAWLVARNGTTVRRYDSEDPGQSTGEPLPIEQDWMRANAVPGRPEEHLGGDVDFGETMGDFIEANDLAAAISLDVGWRHPLDATAHGGPLLANLPGTSPGPLPPGIYDL